MSATDLCPNRRCLHPELDPLSPTQSNITRGSRVMHFCRPVALPEIYSHLACVRGVALRGAADPDLDCSWPEFQGGPAHGGGVSCTSLSSSPVLREGVGSCPGASFENPPAALRNKNLTAGSKRAWAQGAQPAAPSGRLATG